MSDLISRKALIESVKTWDMQDLYLPTHFIDLIEDEPSVTDTNVGGKWIPCSERLPEPEKEVLLQFENNMVVGFFFVEGGHFDGTTNWYGLADDDCYTDCDAKPIAWQPLPEPYKGEQHEID